MIYSGIPAEDRLNYDKLVQLLTSRYSGKQAVEIHKAYLTGRVRKPNEDIAALRDEIWGLVRKAYPHLDRPAQESLALDALLRAVDFDLRVRCVDQGCKNMDEAVTVMLRYEALLESDPARRRKQVREIEVNKDAEKENDRFQKLESLLTGVLERIENMHMPPRPKRFNKSGEAGDGVVCYNCNKQGHYARNCPQKDQPRNNSSVNGLGNAHSSVGH